MTRLCHSHHLARDHIFRPVYCISFLPFPASRDICSPHNKHFLDQTATRAQIVATVLATRRIMTVPVPAERSDADIVQALRKNPAALGFTDDELLAANALVKMAHAVVPYPIQFPSPPKTPSTSTWSLLATPCIGHVSKSQKVPQQLDAGNGQTFAK